jgi:hypothetical protein
MTPEKWILRMRDYAIIVFCITCSIAALIFIILSVTFIASVLLSMSSIGRVEAVSIWSECNGDTAAIYVNANEDAKNVTCRALSNGISIENEISIGDLKKGDSDVCIFRLLENSTTPLRFEVSYNNRVVRNVCNFAGNIGMAVD